MRRSNARLLIIISLTAVLALGVGCRRERTGVALPEEVPRAQTSEAPGEVTPDPPRVGEPAPSKPATNTESKAAGRVLRLSGMTEAHRTSNLNARVSATITKVHVVEGQRVAEGDPIATYDMSDMALRIAQAKAGVGQAQAALKTARAALKVAKAQASAAASEARRARKLKKDGAIPSSQAERATNGLAIANAGVGQASAGTGQASAAIATARAGMALAEDQLRHEIARAPFEGIVVKRHASAGEFATAMPPKLLVTLQETRILDLRLQIPSMDTRHVQKGTHVSLYFPDLRKRIDNLTVTRIIPLVNPISRSFSAIVEIDNASYELRPGMYVEAEVKLGSASVPIEAPGKKRD